MSRSPKPARFSVRSRSVDMSRKLAQLRRLAQLDDLGELLQEPGIDLGRARGSSSTVQPRSSARNSAHIRRSFGTTSCLRSAASSSSSSASRGRLGTAGRVCAELERAHRLQERLLERAADRHRLAHRLHLRGQRAVGLRELLEVPARELHDDVVDGRLERGRRQARDVVGNLVEVVAERELGGDLRDREAGGLRRERRRPRHARVHLDDDDPAVGRVDRELDVRSAGLDADAADDPARRVAHPLVFLVGERQRRRDGDAVAGVHAHRVDVLDRADDDEVVGDVAHHLELVFLPADDRLLDEDLVHRAQARGRARPARGTPRCCRRCRRRRRPA